MNMAVKGKNILKSRTVLIAVAQGVFGVLLVVLTELDIVGYSALLKTVLDIILRLDTSEKIG